MKITISRIFETSKIVSDLAALGVGQSASDLMEYLSSFVEQTLRGLRNGLSFQDNIDCQIKVVGLVHDVPQPIEINSPRVPLGIFPIRVTSTSTMIDAFNWYVDNQGRITLRAKFSPTTTARLDTTIVVLF